MECMDHIMTPEYVRENLEIIHQKDGGLHQIFKDKEGEVISTSYSLFPGVVLIFKEVHRHSYISNWRQKPDQGLLVEFCKEGRLECQVGEECLYHATGDVILFRTDYTARNLRYPLNHFHSIAIAVKMDELSPLFSGYLDQADLKIDSLFQKYQLDQHFFRVLKVNHQLESFFSEINDAPEAIKINYWKVKIFELLLLLFSMGTEIAEHDGDTIRLVTDGTVGAEDISVYAASRFGVAKLAEENMTQLDEVFLGTFAAAYPKQSYDIDGDEQNENVFFFAKTDLRSVQPNSGITPLMRDKNVAIEIGMDSFERLFVYYQTKPLGEREVTVYLADGTSFTCTTDAAGYLPELTVKQIRAGVTVEYAPNGLNTYIARYVPETNTVLSSALMPAIVVLVLSFAAIALCVLLRGVLNRRKGRRDYTFRNKIRRTYKPGFVIIRWMVMFTAFLLLTWGGSWLGYWFEELYIPVLSCSKYNQEQIVASSCYYMSHLNILFTLPIEKILIFFACFFIPLFVFGKLFCGFVCPMGFVQDVLHVTRQKTGVQGVSLTEKLYERLAIIKWTAVMLFLGMGFAGLDFCNICPAVTLSPAFSGFKTTVYISGFVMVFVMVASFFKSRFFCNICPLGLLMGLFHKVTLVRLKKDCTACTECGACYNACPMGIKSIYTEREQKDVTTINCIMCGECIRNCPEDEALKMTLAGMPLYTSSRDKFMKRFDKKKETEK